MSMILASFACLSWTKMMSSPVASTILSHCLLKSHRTLNPVQIFYHFLWGMHNCTTDLPIPILSSHTVANAHTARQTLSSVVLLSSSWANLYIHLVRWLNYTFSFFSTLSTYRWFLRTTSELGQKLRVSFEFFVESNVKKRFPHKAGGFDFWGFSRLDCEQSLLEKVQRACWYSKKLIRE